MPPLLRFSGGSRRDPAIDEWLSKADERTALAQTWFKRIRACGEDVLELMHDGCPTACIEDAPFAYVKLKAGRLPDAAALEQLIDAAYLDVKLRLHAE